LFLSVKPMTWRHDVHRNDIQHKDTQQNYVQHKGLIVTKHKRHISRKCYHAVSSFLIMLIAIMLNVVAPYGSKFP
jgi:hypothetical protein